MTDEILALHEDDGDEYISRRRFLDRLGTIAGGSAAALVLVPRLEAQSEQSPKVAENDARVVTSRIEYDAPGAKMSAYVARPKADGKRPAVPVIHENRGLNAHIEDVTRRLAVEGFLAIAPDALSPLGGTPKDENEAVRMIGTLDNAETVARYVAAIRYLASRADSTGKVGVVGFCWGGGMVNQLAAAGTSLDAAVSYYGRQLPADEVPKITAPLLLHYGSLDARIDAGIPAFEAALKANNKTYELYMYEGANHAFNNDTNPARYNKAAADLAWSRTIAFLRKYLRT
jgi:carboxymethylenebutenolidase